MTPLPTFAEDQLIAIARENAQDGLVGSHPERVWKIVEKADVAFALWPDKHRRSGSNLTVIKGELVLKFIAASGVPEILIFEVIPCRDLYEANFLRAAFLERHPGLR